MNLSGMVMTLGGRHLGNNGVRTGVCWRERSVGLAQWFFATC